MLKIREVREKDLDRLIEIINQPSIIRYMPLEKPVKMEKVRGWYESFIRFKQPAIFVMELDRVIGACSVRGDGKITIWVSEGFRRKGHGTATVEWLKKYARKKGLSRLWLECFKNNRNALRFYRNLGFEDVGKRENSLMLELRV